MPEVEVLDQSFELPIVEFRRTGVCFGQPLVHALESVAQHAEILFQAGPRLST